MVVSVLGVADWAVMPRLMTWVCEATGDGKEGEYVLPITNFMTKNGMLQTVLALHDHPVLRGCLQ